MKKILNGTMPILLAGLLVSQAGFSKNLDKNELAIQCETISNQLYELSWSRAQESCASDVEVAGGYMQFASHVIGSGDTRRGLSSLKNAEKELLKVKNASLHCEYFSPLVSPYIDEIIQLQSELGLAYLLNKAVY